MSKSIRGHPRQYFDYDAVWLKQLGKNLKHPKGFPPTTLPSHQTASVTWYEPFGYEGTWFACLRGVK